ncbi:MAG: phosphoribosylanthranilate isomerase [Xanthobacteraceae bacterium]
MPLVVKICGLTTYEAVDAAIGAGADMVGFVFFEASPRHVPLLRAVELVNHARDRAETVVLTVDADAATIEQIAVAVEPDWIQLHGHEPPDTVRAIRRIHALKVMKALPVAVRDDLAAVERYVDAADRILFDARPPRDATRPGGHGVPFDWHLLKGLDPALPFMLSGGLTPDNVAEAMRITGATAIDASSGVESAPGLKDAEKIEAFIRAADRAYLEIAPPL